MSSTSLPRLGAGISVSGVVVLIGLTMITACDSAPTSPAEEARVQVLLTDFPLDAIASVEVSVSRIYLTGGGDGHVDLFNDQGSPHEIDLLWACRRGSPSTSLAKSLSPKGATVSSDSSWMRRT